jgi:hypothetical protein
LDYKYEIIFLMICGVLNKIGAIFNSKSFWIYTRFRNMDLMRNKMRIGEFGFDGYHTVLACY